MPLTGVYGKGGSGKNTIVTWFMKKYFDDINKYVNFNLDLPNTKKIDSISLFELEETGEPIIVIWDEAYTEGLDNRDSFTEENKIQSYLLFQARKNNMSIISIAQLNMLDTRWRQLEENIIFCFDRPIYDMHLKPYKGDFHYAFIKNSKYTKFTLRYKEALKIFPYFKDKEKILPKNFEEMKKRIKLKNPKELIKYVDNIVKKIIKKCDCSVITHDRVKEMFLEINEIDFSFEKYVYIKLKRLQRLERL